MGARAHSSVPRLNVAIAMTNTVLVDSRSSSHPVTGITTAIVSMNAVVSHCAVRSVTEKSSMMALSATFMVVSLRMTTKAATMRIPMTPRGRAVVMWSLSECRPLPGLGQRVGADVRLAADREIAGDGPGRTQLEEPRHEALT